MAFACRPQLVWQLRTRTLTLGARTAIMGIVNLTPDSFSGDGLLGRDPDESVAHALRLLDEGADILDLGGESTRPGAGAGSDRAISVHEEGDRLLPVLEALHRERPHAVLSVDTYRAETARAALVAGAEIVNDVSGFLWDPAMAATCAQAQCGVVLTHARGRPDEWRTLPPLPPHAVIPLVRDGLRESLPVALEAGLHPENIVLDPGYGFGKAFEANYALLAGQAELLSIGRPLLAGVSRKAFLGRTLGRLHRSADVSPRHRDHATLAASVAAILNGASLLRVHAVDSAVEAAAIADAVLAMAEPD